METLPDLKSPSGHSAYCGVCWEPTFRFWCDRKHAPDYTKCGVGDYTAQTCPNATGSARQKAAVQRLKDAGLWVGSLGASLANEANPDRGGMNNLKEREVTQSAAITLVTAGHIKRFAKPGEWRVYTDGSDVLLEVYPFAATKVATTPAAPPLR